VNDILQLLNKISEQLNSPSPELITMTLRETSNYSGLGYETLNTLVHSENTDFPFFKVGKRVMVNRRVFDEWLRKISEEHRKI
jgi:hypothetical protein